MRGDELAAALGIEPGPRLGRLLAAIDEARFAGEVPPRGDASRSPARLLAATEPLASARRCADPDCLFCTIVAGEIPATIVAEDERTIAFMDINPATRGHALVIPRAHARDVHEIDAEDLAAVARIGPADRRAAVQRLGADGVNLLNSSGAAAWQTVFHFHLHVIPRYAGDPLRLPWTPAPGDMDAIARGGRAARRLTAGAALRAATFDSGGACRHIWPDAARSRHRRRRLTARAPRRPWLVASAALAADLQDGRPSPIGKTTSRPLDLHGCR